MQWLIQCTGIPDTNSRPLLDAVKARGLPYRAIGIIPFSHELTGMEEVDSSLPTMFYGSTQLLELAPKQFKPGMFYDPKWFDPRHWVDKRDDLVNKSMLQISVSTLRKNWVDEVTFVKSIKPKLLTGQVLEPEKEDWDRWVLEHADLDGDEQLLLSPWHKIDREWRFFIIEGKIITGSSYKRDGCLIIRDPLILEVWTAANRALEQWIPFQNIVMDLALMRDGTYKVVEFNALNSSGWYNSDVGKVVDKISELYG